MKKEILVSLAQTLGIDVRPDMTAAAIEDELVHFGTNYKVQSQKSHLSSDPEFLDQLQSELEALKAQLEAAKHTFTQVLADKVEENYALRAELEALKNSTTADASEAFQTKLKVKLVSDLAKELKVRQDGRRFTLLFDKEFYDAHKEECRAFLGKMRTVGRSKPVVASAAFNGGSLVIIFKE